MANESGITALGPEDIENNVENLGTVDVSSNAEGTEQKKSAFPQFTDEAKRQRGIEGFKNLKKGFKAALPHIPNLAQEFAPGADFLRYFGILGDIGGQETFQPSTPENVASGIQKIKQGQKVEGGVDVISGGLETLGAASDVMILGAGFTGPLAGVLLGAGVVLKGITKTGKAILQTKKGKTLFAKITGGGVQNTPRKDGDGTEPTINVEEILAESPEDVQELGNTDNLPITYTGDSPEKLLETDGRKNIYKSRLNNVIDTLQNKATGEQFLKTLQKKGNFSPEELKQSELDKFLLSEQNKDKTISLTDIKNYMSENTPEFVIDRRVRNPSETEEDIITDMPFDNEETVPFGETGRYEFEIESAEEYIYDNSPTGVVNELLIYKLKERDGVDTSVEESNFFNFAEETDLTKKKLLEIEANAEELVKNIPSYQEVISQTDLFDTEKRQRFLEMGENKYYEDAINTLRADDERLDSVDLSNKYFAGEGENIVENSAQRSYEDSPEMVYSDAGTGYRIVGDEGAGIYNVYNENNEYVTETYSLDEARIQAQDDAADRGILEYGFDDDEEAAAERFGRTLFHDYKTRLGMNDTYEELPYYINSTKAKRKTLFNENQNHFRQLNNVGHVRSILINPDRAGGKKIYLVEEFQQDPVNVARKEGGFKADEEDYTEIQNILGDPKLNKFVAINRNSFKIEKYGADGRVREEFVFNDPSSQYTQDRPGFSYTTIGPGPDTMKRIFHPKNEEILNYLAKKNLNLVSSVNKDLPNKKDGYKFNFRLALSDAVNKKQTHMNYVAGETHAIRYGEAVPIDSFDIVPDSLIKEGYEKFVKEINQGKYNDDRYRYDSNTGTSFAEYVAGRDNTEIALPFDIDKMNPKYKQKIEEYASGRTQEDFFDDIIMIDINHSRSVGTNAGVNKNHLMVNKNTNEILGIFYSANNPFIKRESQDRATKMFAKDSAADNFGTNQSNKGRMGESFRIKESDRYFKGKSELPDKITGNKNKNQDLLSEDELKKLKGEIGYVQNDPFGRRYYDQYTDLETQGKVVGGMGKKTLYNDMIKKYGEQYLKKIDPDVKIYREIMTDDEGQKILTFGFKITDKIRKHILTEGIESFNKGGVVLILNNTTPKKIIKKYTPTITKKDYGSFVDKNTHDLVYRDA